MKTVGITGNSGSGKSLIGKYLGEKGAAIINADLIAAEILRPDGLAYGRFVELFGEKYLLHDGYVDKKKLADLIFSDSEQRERLDKLTHPLIIERCFTLAEEAGKNGAEAVFIEAALLIESRAAERVDEIWLVTASHEQKMRRIINRDSLTEEAATKRLAAQATDQELTNKADKIAYKIVENNGDIKELYQKIDALYAALLSE